MKIDLSVLAYQDKIDIDEEIVLDNLNLSQSEIKSLSPIKLQAVLTYTADDKIEMNYNAEGTMVIEDAISLKEITYPFTIEESEIFESLQKTIDINEILWQNIILEIPIKYTKEKDLKKFHGDGWKLISEEELVNKPLANLIENMEKEWYYGSTI